MSRIAFHRSCDRVRALARLVAGLALGSCAVGLGLTVAAPSASADGTSPTSVKWCEYHGASVIGWVGSTPNLAICGPGPAYGGSWGYIDIPGPYGATTTYYNATPGFQCVELAERYLAVVDGLAPVKADGSTVALNYHLAYPHLGLVVNGSRGAIGNPPTPGDVLSVSFSPDFVDGGDGHVAVVTASQVDPLTGNGTVTVAQENAGTTYAVETLNLRSWRLSDPTEPGNVLLQYPYGEWLEAPLSTGPGAGTSPELDSHLVRLPQFVLGTLGARRERRAAHRAAQAVGTDHIARAGFLRSRVAPLP